MTLGHPSSGGGIPGHLRLSACGIALVGVVVGTAWISAWFWREVAEFRSWDDARASVVLLSLWFLMAGVVTGSLVPWADRLRASAMAAGAVVVCWWFATWNQLVIAGEDECVAKGNVPASECMAHEGAAGMALMVSSIPPLGFFVTGVGLILLVRWKVRGRSARRAVGSADR